MWANNLNKTGYHDELFNRLAHYNHLLEASDSNHRKEDSELRLMTHAHQGRSRFDTKVYKSAEKERRTNNNILLKKLIAIHKKRPQPPPDRYEEFKKREGRSVQYRSLEADKELQRQNKELMIKLYRAKPKVGSHD